MVLVFLASILKIHLDFSYEAFHCDIKCTNPFSRDKIHTLKKWSIIQEAIRYLNAMEIDNKKDVLRQQMNSMKACCVGEKKYEFHVLRIRSCEMIMNFQVYKL